MRQGVESRDRRSEVSEEMLWGAFCWPRFSPPVSVSCVVLDIPFDKKGIDKGFAILLHLYFEIVSTKSEVNLVPFPGGVFSSTSFGKTGQKLHSKFKNG